MSGGRLRRTAAMPWKGIFLAMVCVVSASWTADALKGEILFAPLFAAKWPGALASALIFLLSSVLLYRHRRDLLALNGISQSECRPHKCLVMIVSPSNADLLPQAISFPLSVTSQGSTAVLYGEDLGADIAALDSLKWNWQQVLRGVRPHHTILRKVWLVGSDGEEGSFHCLESIGRLIGRYLPVARIETCDEAVSFEDFNIMVETLAGIIRKSRQEGFRDDDIVIDITGGQKTASIAGAAITMISGVTFQYVQTMEPNGVVAYDVAVQSPISA